MSKINLREFANELVQGQSYSSMRQVIEKELLHYEILAVMANTGYLDNIVFQGGTSLRLCYGSDRYSEDLDFAGGHDFDVSDFVKLKGVLEAELTKKYDISVEVGEPKPTSSDSNSGVTVKKWQIKVVTAPSRPDIPKQKIKLEIANIPAYTKQALPLVVNYPQLSPVYSQILVVVETKEEIMADKLLSLASTINHIRYRDIWDLRWLAVDSFVSKEQANKLVPNKIADYSVDNYRQKAKELLIKLPEIVHSQEFYAQMQRFIPSDILQLTLSKQIFLENTINVISGLYHGLLADLA